MWRFVVEKLAVERVVCEYLGFAHQFLFYMASVLTSLNNQLGKTHTTTSDLQKKSAFLLFILGSTFISEPFIMYTGCMTWNNLRDCVTL
jgi:hypothetical protein